MKRTNKRYLIYIVVFLVVAGVLYLLRYFQGVEPEYVFSTTKVTRASVNNTVTATGTLEAANTVVVGTQVSGVIEKLYVDFNSKVQKGQLLAELDKSTLLSSLQNSEADLEKAQANFEYQKLRLARNKIMFEKGLLAKSEYDLILFNYKTSQAEVKSAKANLSRAKRNLSYASIYSPIEGIVLNRAVEEGQTVAASMNTPELFTITNDLSVMEVEANIDEADIGQLEVGQRVEFTVDAFSERFFKGNVTEIRLQPNEASNVITYTAIVEVSNSDLKLKPGMTTSITIYIEEANDVLLIPTKAIRFSPNPQVLDAYRKSTAQERKASKLVQEKHSFQLSKEQQAEAAYKKVWIKEGKTIYPVVIEVGVNDGSNVEVISGLEEGATVVTSFELAEDSVLPEKEDTDNEQKSPFIQKRQKRRGGGPPH